MQLLFSFLLASKKEYRCLKTQVRTFLIFTKFLVKIFSNMQKFILKKQVSILLRQIITLKMWLHQSGNRNNSINKTNTGLGLVDTNKDKKYAKHQSSKRTYKYIQKKENKI